MPRFECCICLEKAVKPVRLPCSCKSILCLDCFRKFMDEYSNCLICREKIVQRLRRLCAGRDYECLVLDKSKIENELEGDPPSPLPRVRIQAPEPGELQRELARLNAQFERERQEEEKASLALLEELTSKGDPDIVELKRLKEDEELARRLQENENQVAERQSFKSDSFGLNGKGGNTIKILLQGGKALQARYNATLSWSDGVQLIDLESTEVSVATCPGKNSGISNEHEVETRSTQSSEGSTAKSDTDDAAFSLKNSISLSSSLDDCSRLEVVEDLCEENDGKSSLTHKSRQLLFGSSKDEHKVAFPARSKRSVKVDQRSEKLKVSRLATWTCAVCTYAETSISWLRCDMCGASKHQAASSSSQVKLHKPN